MFISSRGTGDFPLTIPAPSQGLMRMYEFRCHSAAERGRISLTFAGNTRTKALVPLLILGALVLGAQPVSGLTVGPANITLDVRPGQAYDPPLLVSLGPGEPGSSFTLGVSGLGQSPLDGTYTAIDAASDTGGTSARTFITVDPAIIQLKPGGSAEVKAVIRVPADARDGGRYAAIQVRPEGTDSGQSPVLIPVLLTLEGGNITETGEITTITFTSNQSGADFQVGTFFQDTGNHDIPGAINTVDLEDMRGAVVATARGVSPENALIPGQEVQFSATVKGGIPSGVVKLVSRIGKDDGTLLAEQEESLQAGESMGSEQTLPVSTPGFGATLAILAAAALASRVKRPPPGLRPGSFLDRRYRYLNRQKFIRS